jgi:hypothetical protein
MYDLALLMAPLKSLSGAACARALEGYTPSSGEKFYPRMRCSVDAERSGLGQQRRGIRAMHGVGP